MPSRFAAVLGRRLAPFAGLLLPVTVLADHPSLSFDISTAGPVTTLPAHTLPQGSASLSLSLQYIDNRELSDAALRQAAARDEEVHSTAGLMEAALSGAYGLTDDLTLGLRLPYIERMDVREAEHHHGGGDRVVDQGNARGLGDMTVFSQYRFFTSGDERHAAAVLLGAVLPTGFTRERTRQGELFGVDEQPGAGAAGGLFGISWSSAFGRLGVDANVLYTLMGEGARNTHIGDSLNYNLSLAWRVETGEQHVHADGHVHNHGLLQNIDFVLELNGDRRQRVETGGVSDDNTGGNIIYLSPGLRLGLAAGWSAYASVGVPVVRDFNGLQSEPDYRVFAGLSKSFW